MTTKPESRPTEPVPKELVAERAQDRRALGVRDVIYPAESWHVSRYEALRQVGAALKALTDPRKDADTLRREIQALLARVEATRQGAWEAYLLASEQNLFHRDQFASFGEPDYVEMDDDEKGGEIKAMWKMRRDTKEHWGIFEVYAAGDARDQPTLFSLPFRDVALDTLPKDCQKIHLTDKQIAAAFMLLDVLETALRDMRQFARDATVEQTWQRMIKQSQFYRGAVEMALQTLPGDYYSHWRSSPGSSEMSSSQDRQDKPRAQISMDEAPSAIAEVAATARAMRVVALDIVAAFYAKTITRCESQMTRAGESAWIDTVLRELTEQIARYRRICDGYEKAMLAWAKVTLPPGMAVMRITQPVPDGVPLLALIPENPQADPISLPDPSSAER
jgi:hypothetical protein